MHKCKDKRKKKTIFYQQYFHASITSSYSDSENHPFRKNNLEQTLTGIYFFSFHLIGSHYV